MKRIETSLRSLGATLLFPLTVTAFVAASTASAVNLYWRLDGDSLDGDYSDLTNWTTSNTFSGGSDPEVLGTGDFYFMGGTPDPKQISLQLTGDQGTGNGGLRVGIDGAAQFTLSTDGSGPHQFHIGSMHIGRYADSSSGNGTVELQSGGILQLTSELHIGRNSNVDGSVRGTGVLNIHSGATLGQTGGPIRVGEAGGHGTLNLFDGGTISKTGGSSVIVGQASGNGYGSTGIVNQSGGDFGISSNLFVGNQGGTGTYHMSGGNLTIDNGFIVGRTDGQAGTGTFNFSGGTVDAAELQIGHDTSTGTFEITGGTFNTGRIYGGDGTSSATFDGGQIVASASSTTEAPMVSNLDAATIDDGGLNLDVNGHQVYLVQDFGGTGAITVSNGAGEAGEVSLDGSTGGDVTVGEDVTFFGNGTAGGAVLVQVGATLAPGNSIGTFSASSVLLDGRLEIEVGGETIDLLNVAGELDISNASLDIVSLGEVTGDVLVFATYGTLIGAEFADVQGLGEWTIDYAYGDAGNIALVIPEPSTYALFGGVGMLALALVRRRLRG